MLTPGFGVGTAGVVPADPSHQGELEFRQPNNPGFLPREEVRRFRELQALESQDRLTSEQRQEIQMLRNRLHGSTWQPLSESQRADLLRIAQQSDGELNGLLNPQLQNKLRNLQRRQGQLSYQERRELNYLLNLRDRRLTGQLANEYNRLRQTQQQGGQFDSANQQRLQQLEQYTQQYQNALSNRAFTGSTNPNQQPGNDQNDPRNLNFNEANRPRSGSNIGRAGGVQQSQPAPQQQRQEQQQQGQQQGATTPAQDAQSSSAGTGSSRSAGSQQN